MWRVQLLAFLPFAVAQTTFSSANFQGILNQDSGVLQSLRPAGETGFDFSPSDFFERRNGIGQYHTGDLTMRWRSEGEERWKEIDTAANRDVQPIISTEEEGVVLRSTFDGVFPDAGDIGITRDWIVEDGDMVLQATITNKGNKSLEIGAFGFPIEFNSIFTTRTAEETTAKCVLMDPYIGLDAGYVQVTRLTGTGPNLVITPFGTDSRFEAWRFLSEKNTSEPFYYQSQTFEGFYSWEMLSRAYAENEWNATEPWNEPTSKILESGESVTFGLRFGVSMNNHEIEDVVAEKGVPVAVGLPGYVLPVDTTGKLFLKSSSDVKDITIEPKNSLSLIETTARNPAWKAYNIKASESSFGRARLTITYQDNLTQTIHYFLTASQRTTATKFANFLFNQQYYTNTSDPFGRAPSIITYDFEEQTQLLQAKSTWFAGLSDEAGAGSFVAAAMKTSAHPIPSEVQKLEEMVNETVWGGLQHSTGNSSSAENLKHGVKKSLFYYDREAMPDFDYDGAIDWSPPFPSWDKQEAESIGRAYDYVHVSALYWAFYAAERVSPGVLKIRDKEWYLKQAFETIMAVDSKDEKGEDIVSYRDVGLMGETVWLSILKALKEEGLEEEEGRLEGFMRERQERWAGLEEPYGSEMAWDSTGQEGVYAWSR